MLKWKDSRFWKTYLRSKGYTKAIAVHGEVGYTELGMHTRKAHVHGQYAFVRPGDLRYAFVLLADGSVLDGCFCLFSDKTFSLS